MWDPHTQSCRKPDARFVFDRIYGARGYSPFDLDQRWRSFQRLSPAKLCLQVEKLGMSQQRAAWAMGMPRSACDNIDQIIRDPPPISSKFKKNPFGKLWKAVVSKAKILGWPSDWQPHQIDQVFTQNRIDALVNLIDEHFFENQLKRSVGLRGNELVVLRWVPAQPPEVDEFVPPHPRAAMMTTVRHVPGNPVYVHMFAENMTAVGIPIELDGVNVKTRLEYVARTLGHELIHVLLFFVCPHLLNADGGHGEAFRIFNNRFMGSSLDEHGFQDEVVFDRDVPKDSDVELTKFVLRKKR